MTTFPAERIAGPTEVAEYQDEPGQAPAGAPGKVGYLRLGFERRGDTTALVDLERRAPLLVQQALHFDEGMPGLACVYIISVGGGILQGDRYRIEMRLEANAQAYVTTQSATKVHEMDANYATQEQDIVLEDGAYLEYLPDVTIPFKHSRFVSRTSIAVAANATLLYGESLMPGRKYHDEELFAYDVFSSLVSARRLESKEQLFVEKLVATPRRSPPRRTGVMGAFDVFANVILLTPKVHADRIFALVPAEVDLDAGLLAAPSRLPNDAGLIFKVAGVESGPVRKKVREYWSRVRFEVTGCTVPNEFPWR